MMNKTKTAGLGTADLLVAALINITLGFNIIAVKMAVVVSAPLTAGGLRQACVLLMCLPFLRWVPGRMPVLLAVAAINGSGYLALTNLAMSLSDNVSSLAIAGQMSVPISLLLGIVFLGERISWVRLAGIVLAFAGVVILVFDPAVFARWPALVVMVIGSLIFAVGTMLQRYLVGVPILVIFAWVGLGGAAGMLPMAVLFEPHAIAAVPDLRLSEFSWIFLTAIGATIIGQGGIAWLLQRHPLSTVMPMTLAAPVISVGASWLYFGIPMTPVMIAGALLAIAGVAIITLRSARAGKGEA